MELIGKMLHVLPVQNIASQKGPLKKLEFVIEVEAKFPRKICFNLWNDKVDIFSSRPGDPVKVFFDIESREYKGRWYTEAKAWKVENLNAVGDLPPSDTFYPDEIKEPPAANQDIDDLPF